MAKKEAFNWNNHIRTRIAMMLHATDPSNDGEIAWKIPDELIEEFAEPLRERWQMIDKIRELENRVSIDSVLELKE